MKTYIYKDNKKIKTTDHKELILSDTVVVDGIEYGIKGLLVDRIRKFQEVEV